MKLIYNIIFITVILLLFFNLSLPVLAQNDTAERNFFKGLWETSEKAGYGIDESTPGFKEYLPTRIGIIIKIILSFLGVIFLILIIYGGFVWMTASGNDQQIAKAKGILFNSIIGLVVILAAYAITAYFGGEFSKALVE